VAHDVPGDFVQPLVAGDQVVILAKDTLQLPLLLFIELGILDHLVDVLV
jgi:hypothetical protein